MAGLMLSLDASTYDGSVAVIQDHTVLVERTVAMRGENEERLMPAIADALLHARVSLADLAGIVCGAGPGSFTSLRIAASLAKGLAHGRGVPLYAVSSLELAAVEAGIGRWCLTMDALRGEVYVAAYLWNGRVLTKIAELPAIVPERDVAKIVTTYDLRRYVAAPHARGAVPLLEAIMSNGPVDLASWEPNYGRLAEAQVRWEAVHGPLPS